MKLKQATERAETGRSEGGGGGDVVTRLHRFPYYIHTRCGLTVDRVDDSNAYANHFGTRRHQRPRLPTNRFQED